MTLPLIGTGVAALGSLVWGAYDPTSPLFGRVIGRGPKRERVLYLTFDDGPQPPVTARILETLDRERVPAAFFLVGAGAAASADGAPRRRGGTRDRQPHPQPPQAASPRSGRGQSRADGRPQGHRGDHGRD